MSKIDETLKKIAGGTSKGNSPISSSTKPVPGDDLSGDPNCPYCQGLGFLRADVPVGHPDFGRLQICACRKTQVTQQIRQRLFSLSNLDELRTLTFENFQPRGRIGLGPLQADSLERAYNHARLFAQTLNGWLFIQGPYGCGKTHLAAAIANFAVSVGVMAITLLASGGP